MLRNPLIGLVALSCIALAGACADSSSVVVGNTEINLLISDPASEPDELAFTVETVSYRITCPATNPSSGFDNSVDISGDFEIDDSAVPTVYSLVTNLPLTTCTITFFVRDPDGEVVCSGDALSASRNY